MKLQKLILVLLLFLSFQSFSQGEVAMEVISTNFATGKKEGGANVRVYEGSTQVSSTTTAGNGSTVLTLDAGKIYKIEVSKPGKVTRFILVDTKAVNDELIQGSAKLKGAVSISLFDEAPNVDYSYVTQNQITTFYYDGKTPELVFKADEAAKMKAQIDKLMKNAEADAKAADANYNAAIKAGDAFYAQKKYTEAIAEYEKASMAKPKEPYPAQKIAEIEAIQKAENAGNEAKKQAEADYQNLITAANTLRDQKKYAEAKAKYQEALTKKQEQYPKDEIIKCDAAIANAAKEAENKKIYDAAMAAGNSFFGQKSWMAAKDEYKKALKAIPEDPAAKAKLSEIDVKLNAQKEEQVKKDNYEKLVAEADALFTGEKYADAKAKYNEALKIIPSSQHPTQRVTECDAKIAAADALKAKQAQIEKLLTEGNTAFTANQLPAAKTKFQEVLKLDAENAVAKGKIDEIDKKIADEKANAEKIKSAQALVAEGDALAKSAKHTEAIAKYNAAQAIYNDPAVQPKIDASNAALKSAQDAAAKKASFDKAIEDGNAALTAKNYEAAKAKYNEAASIDASSAVPKTKLAEVDKAIAADKSAADAAAKKAAFEKAIQDGDAALATKNYEAAKAKYTEAAGIDASSTVPKSKIAEVDKMIAADKSAADAATKKAAFEKAIQEGDAALATKNYEAAKAKYTEAAGIDASSTVPKSKIAEVDKMIAADKSAADAATKKAAFEKAIQEGDAALAAKNYADAKTKYGEAAKADASSTIPKEKIAAVDKIIADEKSAADAATKKAAFEKAIQEGDAALAAKNYADAKTKYGEAAKADASSTLPKEKIAAVDKIIADEKSAADAAAAATAAANKKAAFEKAIQDGDAALAAKNYTEAKAKYNEAAKVDASSALPKEKIASVDKVIADEKSAADAAAASAAAATKKANYDKALAEGNALFDAKDYDGAKAKYNEAVAIDGTRNEAKDKLAQITKLASDQAALEQQKKQYDAAVADGSALLASGKLTEAKAKFVEANKIDATQQLPMQKITEIDGMIAVENQKKEVAKLLSEGNAALSAKKYADAKTKYNAVLALDSKNEEAKTKLQEAITAETASIGEQAKQEKFQALKAEGIALMSQSKYLEAKAKLTEAKAIQADADVDKKIVECDAKLAEIAKGAEADQKYTQLMTQAKGLEASNKLDEAIAKYNEALAVKNEQEPKDRIAAIKTLKDGQANAAKLDEEFNKLVKQGDDAVATKKYTDAIAAYDQALAKKNDPAIVAKRAAAEKASIDMGKDEAEEQYQKILSAGQKAIDEKNYSRAIEMYNRAITNRSNDPFPKQKLDEINNLMKAEADLKAKNEAYQAKVTEAEAAAKAGKIENAITLFEAAKTIKPDETLPANRIAELKAQLATTQTSTVDPQAEIDKKYQAAMTAGTALAQSKDYNGAIGKYQEALAVKPKDKEATAKIAEMRQILDDINTANKNKAELDKLIAEADAYFKASDWLKAKNAYDQVLLKDATNSYSKAQINICEKNLDIAKGTAEEKEYKKLIGVADKNFDKEDYKKAKEYYERATNIRKADPYPKRRLAEIEALLNPKPVVVQQPPVSKDPQKLPNLGIPSNSTEEEDGSKLEQGKIARKYRNRNKVEAIRDSASVAGLEGVNIQKERTTNMNTQFAELKKENGLRADSSDIGRNNNIAEIRKTDAEMAATTTELTTNKTSDIQYTNGQLDVIKKDVNEQNKVYDQSAATNAEIVKQNRLAHDENNLEVSENSYQENLLADVILSDVKAEQGAKAVSDTKERLEVRDQLVEIEKDNQNKQTDLVNDKTQTIYRTNNTIEDITSQQNELAIEDRKQSPNNQVKIEQINKETAELSVAESQQHQQNMLSYKQIIDEDKKAQYEYDANAGQQRIDNMAEVTEIKKEQQENDRINYNNVYVKSVNNQTDIEATKVVQGEYSKLPSIATAANAAAYTEIHNQNLEKNKEDQASEYTKYTGNQSNITDIKNGVNEQNAANQGKSSNNAEVLNDKKTGLGDTEKKMAQDQQKKNLDAKQTLTNIENAEPIVGTKAPNDLGKLYPEGVSQEKFDQMDKNNVVVAIITRRVVVEAGHGDEYIKTQSLNATTYTKNGVAISENTWLKETQSAKLVKNY